MRSFRLALLVAAGLCVVAGIAALVAFQSTSVQDAIVRVGLKGQLTRESSQIDLPGLHVVLCGSSSPLSSPDRAQPCTLVAAGERWFVVDTGPGSWNNLALWQVRGERIGGVLLTHFHSDHIGGLGEYNLQTWVAGRPAALPVFGPPGVERVVAGFRDAYALDTGYRIEHHGRALLDSGRGAMRAVPVLTDGAAPVTVLDENGLTIRAVAVDHDPVKPALGYRFDYQGRSVVVSGDTVPTQSIREISRDVDVLVHEAQANHIVAQAERVAGELGRERIEKILSDIPDYHTTPVEAAEIARDAGVGLLVLTHLTPPPPNRFVERVFLRGVDEVRDHGVVLGYDGLLISLPPDGNRIEIGRMD